MYILSQIIVFLVLQYPQSVVKSPHGNLNTECKACHTTSGWKVELGTISFKHDTVGMKLVGQHASIDCKMCHSSLVFNQASNECNSCHTDMHEQTVGTQCERCHSPDSWIVTNIDQIHQQSRFPLFGAHLQADCYSCHKTENYLRFDVLNTECFGCHNDAYNNTDNPNHVLAGYSTNCTDCHNLFSFQWAGSGFNHNFFPLSKGHNIDDCNKCHTSGSFSGISADCYSCHASDFEAASNPNHINSNFPTSCTTCHTTDVGWSPADFQVHDSRFFPIYSGKHNGEWNSCLDCHTNASDYSMFSCIDCHEHNKSKVDGEHDEVGGYQYNSISCYECHPSGSEEGSFNHNKSVFPLTGAHLTTDCSDCHQNEFAGTNTECTGCHTEVYNTTTNPNHGDLNLSDNCTTCHTTNTGWSPATFPVHNDFYELKGTHLQIQDDCSQCHEGNYQQTLNTCFDCHTNEYNQSNNPPHASAQFSEDCETCHNQAAWVPSTFDHDLQYFPVYTGKHSGEWNLCSECHNVANDYAIYTCIDCHDHNKAEMDDEHREVTDYVFESTACFDCHPRGTSDEGDKIVPAMHNFR